MPNLAEIFLQRIEQQRAEIATAMTVGEQVAKDLRDDPPREAAYHIRSRLFTALSECLGNQTMWEHCVKVPAVGEPSVTITLPEVQFFPDIYAVPLHKLELCAKERLLGDFHSTEARTAFLASYKAAFAAEYTEHGLWQAAVLLQLKALVVEAGWIVTGLVTNPRNVVVQLVPKPQQMNSEPKEAVPAVASHLSETSDHA